MHIIAFSSKISVDASEADDIEDYRGDWGIVFSRIGGLLAIGQKLQSTYFERTYCAPS